ncbi:MAG: hypothetical protein ACYCU0_03220 [Solirubrobacteraceae bacterium]
MTRLSPIIQPVRRQSRGAAAAAARREIFLALLLVLAQSAVGIVVNLYAKIPAAHSGAKPGDYFTGSFDSVVWAIAHGPLSLTLHAVLGIALVLFALHAIGRAHALRDGFVTGLCVLAAALAIGAGFNGASFLDFAQSTSSLIMALLAFASIGAYASALMLLRDR